MGVRLMIQLYKINEVFDTWQANLALFDRLNLLDVPWKDDITSMPLNYEYIGNRSGEKYCAPIVTKLLLNGVLTTSSINTLCNILFALYNTNWTKQYNTLSAEYDPIENYSMVENMNDDITEIEHGHVLTRSLDTTDERTPNVTEERTDDLTHTKTGTDTITPNLTTTTDNGITGFNSSTDVHTGETVQTNTGTNETEYDTSDTDSGTVTTVTTGTDTETHSGSITDTNSGTDTHTHNYELTRSGNIGVTTSQQMLQSEHDLWKWNFFNDVVFPDIDRVLTLMIY